MAAPTFDREKALRVLIDAKAMGDAAACRRHGVTARTLQRYRVRLDGDPELSQAVAAKTSEVEADWRDERRGFLLETLRKMRDLIAEASPADLPTLVNAFKTVAEVEVTAEILLNEARAAASRPGASAHGSQPARGVSPPPVH